VEYTPYRCNEVGWLKTQFLRPEPIKEEVKFSSFIAAVSDFLSTFLFAKNRLLPFFSRY